MRVGQCVGAEHYHITVVTHQIASASLKPGVIGTVAARLEKEEASSGGPSATRPTPTVVLDSTGAPVQDTAEPVPALLQKVDERTNARPWWMDEKVVASIETADRGSDPTPEPRAKPELEPKQDAPDKIEEAKRDEGSSKTGNVKDKAAALEKGAAK